ncbi:MAG: hypothetical protein A4E72_01896 [Syntrophus sp. PtaU1.Bin208]|nr:MAG: hypothetical protein A4E72_01896 [Syntrophus sp. PtaU1.Bin208]
MDNNGIHARVVKNRFDGKIVNVQIGSAMLLDGRPNVDGIGDGHPFRVKPSQADFRFLGEFRDDQALFLHEIGADDPRGAAEGDDGDSSPRVAPPRGIESQGPAEIDKLLEIFRFISPGLGKRAGGDPVISRQAGGMTDGGLGALAAFAPLQDDHGFVAASAKIEETSAVDEGFEIEPDTAGIRILEKIGEDIAFVDVRLVADRADLAETGDAVA